MRNWSLLTRCQRAAASFSRPVKSFNCSSVNCALVALCSSMLRRAISRRAASITSQARWVSGARKNNALECLPIESIGDEGRGHLGVEDGDSQLRQVRPALLAAAERVHEDRSRQLFGHVFLGVFAPQRPVDLGGLGASIATAPMTVETVTATLTFHGVQQPLAYYSLGGLNGGSSTIHVAMPFDASSLATGRYAYSLSIDSPNMSAPATIDGALNVVND
ncbi:MAG TPA: hypothetical protein VMV69_18015, partial [Pirellulales bacterium]|nr:hypothetical protein [Pirellulales bacterium]